MYYKSLILWIICVFINTDSFGQVKIELSRQLKNSIFVSPIDPAKSYTREGLIGGNLDLLDTIHVKKSIITKENILKDEKEIEVDSIREIVQIDTIFKTPIIIEKSYIFDVIKTIGSYSIIKFWPVSENATGGLFKSMRQKPVEKNGVPLSNFESSIKSLKRDGLLYLDEKETVIFDLSENYYLVKTKELMDNSEKFENKSGLYQIGLTALPVKIRPFATESGQFDFSEGFSLGTTLAYTVHQNHVTNFTHNLLVFVGVGSYTADESKIKEERDDYKIATFSPALGWMWERNGVQLSLMTGIDFPSGQVQKNWVYRNKPWFGIGIGIGLFKLSNEQSTEKSQKNQN